MTAVGIGAHLMGLRALAVDVRPVRTALSLPLAMLVLGDRTPPTVPVFAPRLSSPLRGVPWDQSSSYNRCCLNAPKLRRTDSGVTSGAEPARGLDVERETRQEMPDGVSEGGAAMSGRLSGWKVVWRREDTRAPRTRRSTFPTWTRCGAVQDASTRLSCATMQAFEPTSN